MKDRKRLQKVLVSSLPLWVIAAAACSGTAFGQSSTIVPITVPGAVSVTVNDLGPSGHIVGSYQGASRRAFMYYSNSVVDLGTFGGTIAVANAVNAAGAVAGYSSRSGDRIFRSFRYTGGVLRDLGGLGGLTNSANSINSAGQITGHSTINDSIPTIRAVIHNGSALASIPTLGGNLGYGLKINDAGQVAGESTISGNSPTRVFFYNGAVRDLGTLGGSHSRFGDMNNAGMIAGYSYLPGDGQFHAFLHDGTAMIDLDTLGGSSSRASRINQNGDVIGDSTLPGDLVSHGFLFQGGPMRDLGHLGGDSSSARAINNLGQVVGTSLNASGRARAFLWENGVMNDLNDRLPASSGWELSEANFVNDAGQIAGTGFLNGQPAVFLMTLLVPSNQPPIANAGADVTVECTGALTTVRLDGRGSSDPDGDPLTYQWNVNGVALGAMAVLDVDFPPGSHTVTLIVNDPAEEVGVDTMVVNIVDTTAPSFNCPGAMTISVQGNCQTTVPDFITSLVIADTCDSAASLVRSQTPAPGSTVGVGNHQIVLTVTDTAGNVARCELTLTVADTTAPVFDCPAPMTVAAQQNCQAAVPDLVSALSATDDCTAAAALVRSQTPAPGTAINAGSHQIVLTIADAAGNAAQCVVTLTVTDSTAPIFNCPPPMTVSAQANCQAAVPDLVSSLAVSDDCTTMAALIRSQAPAAGTIVGLGNHQIVLTVTDASGNTAQCTMILTVADTTPPVLNCPAPITVSAQQNCQATVPDLVSGLAASDNCTASALLTRTQVPAADALVGLGSHQIVLTVTDAAGNVASCVVLLTVADTTPPVFICPSPMNLSALENCEAAVPDLISALNASDNCAAGASLTRTQIPAAGTLVGVGNHQVALMIGDAAGNVARCTVTLTVADATPPSFVCPEAIRLVADNNGQAALPNLLAELAVSDNCTASSQLLLIQQPAAGTLLSSGSHDVIISATDASGNSSRCTVRVTVAGAAQDTKPPVIRVVAANPACLRPTGEWVPVTIKVVARDDTDPNPDCRIVSVEVNQPDDPCDTTSPDWKITGKLTLKLRAENYSHKGPRVYTIRVACTDKAGNRSTKVTHVFVQKAKKCPPH